MDLKVATTRTIIYSNSIGLGVVLSSFKISQPNLLRFIIFVVVALSGLKSANADTTNNPLIHINASIDAENNIPSRLHGTIDIEWPSPTEGQQITNRCIILPHLDPEFRATKKINQQLKMLGEKSATETSSKRKVLIDPSDDIQQISDHLYLVIGHKTRISLKFSTIFNIPKVTHNYTIFADDIIPIPTKQCDPHNLVAKRYSQFELAGALKNNSNFELVSPINELESQKAVTLPRLSIALVKGLKKHAFRIDGYEILFHTLNSDLNTLIPTLKSTISSLVQWYGDSPVNKINIIESDALESFLMPGIVPLNRPRQGLFNSLQSEWLNWSHWALATLLSYQWMIPQIQSAHEDDLWFFIGLIDYLTAEILENNVLRRNLFNGFDFDFTLLSMSYKSYQDFTAAILDRYSPFATLTDASFRTLLSYEKQHPILYIKHSMALRHLATIAGPKSLKHIIRRFVERYKDVDFLPAQFVEEIGRMPSPLSGVKRKELVQALSLWWTASGWPDYSLDSVQSHELSDGKWLVEVDIESKGSMSFPVEVDVEDISGSHKRVMAKKTTNDRYVATVVSRFEPKVVEIDPERNIFDSNRFDNSDEQIKLGFFPGNASTLRDDSYTAVWLPYVQRRPGEEFSFGVQTMLLKYIQGTMTMRLEMQNDGKTGVFLQKTDKYSAMGLSSEVFIGQNFDGYRESKLAVKRSPVFPHLGNLAVVLNLRERRIAGDKESAHATFSTAAILNSPKQSKYFDLELRGEHEEAPQSWSQGHWYQRQTVAVSAHIFFGPDYWLSSKLFYGDLMAHGDLQANVLFSPENRGEAGMRLDSKKPIRSEEMISLVNDVFLPFLIPLPTNSILLSSKMKWRLFYDVGSAGQKNGDTHLEDAGFGVLMPFGGDFVGAGSLALTRLSFLTVLHTRVGDNVSKTPGFLFDVSGDF